MNTPSPAPSSISEAREAASREGEVKWLLQVAVGGAAAQTGMRCLIDVYGPKIEAFCRKRGLPKADAEDVAQNVFSRLFEYADRFDATRSPSAWIWGIARNCWADVFRDPFYQRRESASANDEVADDGLSLHLTQVAAPDTEHAAQSHDKCVQRGVQEFERRYPEEGRAVVLRDLEGWSISDVADYLQRSNGATRVFLHSLRQKLEPFLAPCRHLLPT